MNNLKIVGLSILNNSQLIGYLYWNNSDLLIDSLSTDGFTDDELQYIYFLIETEQEVS